MNDAVHIDDNVGRIAYEAWISEFAEDITAEDHWDDLTMSARAAWEDVGEAIIENRVRLPRGGVELVIRRPEGTLGFVWAGIAEDAIAGAVRNAVERALGPVNAHVTDRNGRLLETIWDLNDRFTKEEDDDALDFQFLAIEQYRREVIRADREKTRAAIQRLLSIMEHDPDVDFRWLYGELEALL